MKVFELNDSNRKQLAETTTKVLSNGGVAIVPTDTVYGLICDGRNLQAKDKIFRMKGRSYEKPLIGFVNTIEKVTTFAHIPHPALPFIRKRWPGATTFIFKSKDRLAYMSSNQGNIAFRIPAYNLISDITKEVDIVASTSANISGQETPSTIKQMPDCLKQMADIIICGGRINGRSSSIWYVTKQPPRLLRGNILFVCEGNSCRSPMAEFILRELLKDVNTGIKIESAGINILRCGSSSSNTCEVMKEAGINMDGFTTKPLTDYLVKNADLIFVMDETQRQRILFSFPEAENINVLNVHEPVNSDIEAYRHIRNKLFHLIKESVVPRIINIH